MAQIKALEKRINELKKVKDGLKLQVLDHMKRQGLKGPLRLESGGMLSIRNRRMFSQIDGKAVAEVLAEHGHKDLLTIGPMKLSALMKELEADPATHTPLLEKLRPLVRENNIETLVKLKDR